MARKGLPAKYAKMGFKKGWAAYRAARGTKSRAVVRATPRRKAAVAKRSAPRKARKRPARARALLSAPTKMIRRVVRPGSVMRAGRIAVAAMTGVGGAAASRAVANMIPGGSSMVRGFAQTGMGIAAIMAAPKRGIGSNLKYAGVGATLGGAMMLTRAFFPQIAPYLAGNRRTRVPYYGSQRPTSTVAPISGNADFARRELMGSCGFSLGKNARMRGYGPSILNAYQ